MTIMPLSTSIICNSITMKMLFDLVFLLDSLSASQLKNWNFLFHSYCRLVVVTIVPLLLHHAFEFVFQDRETWPLLKVICPALIHQTVHLKGKERHRIICLA